MKKVILPFMTCLLLLSCVDTFEKKRIKTNRRIYPEMRKRVAIDDVEGLENLREWCKEKMLNVEAVKLNNHIRKIYNARLEFPKIEQRYTRINKKSNKVIVFHESIVDWCWENYLYKESAPYFKIVFKKKIKPLRSQYNDYINDKIPYRYGNLITAEYVWSLAVWAYKCQMQDEFKEALDLTLKINSKHFDANAALKGQSDLSSNYNLSYNYEEQTIYAIQNGIKEMLKRQNNEGSWGGGPKVAATSAVGMALIAANNVPGVGKKGKSLEKAIKYILSRQDKTGFITESSRMYSHAFGMLFLAKAYVVTPEGNLKKSIKIVLTKAVDLSQRVQDNHGGWNYSPSKGSTDIGVSALQLIALLHAKETGINVDEKCIEKMKNALLAAANPDGGFSYRVPGKGSSSWPRTASSLYCLQQLCEKDTPEIIRGLAYLKNIKPDNDNWFYYGNYLVALASKEAGGKYWTSWWLQIKDELLKKQSKDGSWANSAGGNNFATGLALIILQMPLDNHLERPDELQGVNK